MASVTARSATIFIASGDEMKVYHSVEDVPVEMRRRLLETTRSVNSATILIADKRGREELVRALQGGQSSVQSRLVDTIRGKQPDRKQASTPRFAGLRSPWTWLEFLLPIVIGASLWLLLDSHF